MRSCAWIVLLMPFLSGCAGLMGLIEQNEGALQTIGTHGISSGSTVGIVGGGLALFTLLGYRIAKSLRGRK